MGIFLACLFGGWFGLHKFIEKKKGQGFLYLFTVGLCGIGWFVDCIIYLVKLLDTKPQTIKETPPTRPEVILPTYETHKVTGVSHYLDNISQLAFTNDDYELSKKEIVENGLDGDRIYQYEYYPKNIELVPEPDNAYDPKAIKVMIDGVHVGYIKAGSCSRIHNLINNNSIEKIGAFIGGGKYKIVEYDDYEEKYNIEKDETNIFIDLKIYTNKKEVEE